MVNKQNFGDPFSVSVTHSTAAVASKAGVAGKVHYVTDISGSTDKAGALLEVKQGTTVIWQVQLATTAAGINAFTHQFSSPLSGVDGGLVSISVTGTSACYANIAGFTLNL